MHSFIEYINMDSVTFQIPEFVVAFHLDLDGLSWLQIDHEYMVHDWQHIPLPFDKTIKYNHATYLEKVRNIIQLLVKY